MNGGDGHGMDVFHGPSFFVLQRSYLRGHVLACADHSSPPVAWRLNWLVAQADLASKTGSMEVLPRNRDDFQVCAEFTCHGF